MVDEILINLLVFAWFYGVMVYIITGITVIKRFILNEKKHTLGDA